MDSTDDEILGAEAEQEYIAEQEVAQPKKTAKKTKLTSSQRLDLIDAYRHGKTDKFYNVIPCKNKPGEYRVIKRKKPLDIPVVDNSPEPINMNIDPVPQQPTTQNYANEDKSEKKNKIKQEFFTMQNTINNSLSKEIAAVMEKCNKIEAKMKKQKAKMKQQRMQQQEPVYQEEYEYDDEEPVQEYAEYQDYYEPQYYPRFNARSRIDLRNFS